MVDNIHQFSKASGLRLNIDKFEIFALHDQPALSICNIAVKNQVKYLGIVIRKNKEVRQRENVVKCKTILNSWLQRDNTIFGRVLLSKMESLSRTIYPAFSLDISDKTMKHIDTINFKFIWRNKYQYIRRADLLKTVEDGGLNVTDLSTMNGVLKLRWLRSFSLV